LSFTTGALNHSATLPHVEIA
jgi:hypothetical protein